MFRRRLISVWIVIILFTFLFLGVSCSGYTVIPLGLSFIIDPAPDPQINNNAYPVLSSPPHNYLLWLGYAYRFLGRHEDAIEVFQMLLKRSPKNLFAHIWLTATYSAFGREEEARRQSQELLRLDPTFSLVQFAEILAIKDEVSADRFIDDLRKAGLK